jgi:hypothetical protein
MMPGYSMRLAAACALFAVLACAPAAAQQYDKGSLKRVTLSSLAAQGFEVKTAIRDAVVLQMDADVYWCTLRLATTSPLSYQSDCFAVR